MLFYVYLDLFITHMGFKEKMGKNIISQTF